MSNLEADPVFADITHADQVDDSRGFSYRFQFLVKDIENVFSI